jgi:hypothetical protein
MEFRKAVKAKQKLRLAIDGMSGSGKTFTALAIATGLGGSIAVIDSEHGSSELYANHFNFSVLPLDDFSIETYIAALKCAAQNRFDTVIIDSTSHAWDALVARVEQYANARCGGNTFRAWAKGTPLQHDLIEAMLSYPGHVIATCRSKTEYVVEQQTGKDGKTRAVPRKVGLAAVQRQGFEYEFTMTMGLNGEHIALITKDRTGKFQDKSIDKPGEDFGKELIAWLNEGVDTPQTPLAPVIEAHDVTPRAAPDVITETDIDKVISYMRSAHYDNADPIYDEAEIETVRERLLSELASGALTREALSKECSGLRDEAKRRYDEDKALKAAMTSGRDAAGEPSDN